MSMENYFKHLTEDIRRSYEEREANTTFTIHKASTVFKSVPEKYASMSVYPEKKVYKWMGLNLEDFPPAEKWNTEQLRSLCGMLQQLFMEYDYELHIPHELPFDLEYTFLLKALDTMAVNNLMVEDDCTIEVISFCNNDEATCPFGEYCQNDGDGCYNKDWSDIDWTKYYSDND